MMTQAFIMEGWRLLAALAVLGLWCGSTLILYRRAHHHAPGFTPCKAAVPIVYASQSGQAEAIARHTARQLGAAGCATVVLRLDRNWLDAARSAGRALFIVSTYGDGVAPDHAAGFVRRTLEDARMPELGGLRYGLLALGDSGYAAFCAFGRRLDEWLAAAGAQAEFPRIEADRLAPAALQAWQRAIGCDGEAVALSGTGFETWRFDAREHLNPGSPGASLCRILLKPANGIHATWQAGDLVELMPPGGSDPRPRSYSIANLADEGRLELIVRTCIRSDGKPGLVSGWLNHDARSGDALRLRIRGNPGFRLPPDTRRPLLLIGAGAGLAGLRSHLKARARMVAASGEQAPAHCCWLVYGERSPAHDRPCTEEIAQWRRSGVLSRVDLCFSRDAHAANYVQDALRSNATDISIWIADGACVLVCGAATSMARGVDEALREILGAERLEALAEEGCLLRDVF